MLYFAKKHVLCNFFLKDANHLLLTDTKQIFIYNIYFEDLNLMSKSKNQIINYQNVYNSQIEKKKYEKTTINLRSITVL